MVHESSLSFVGGKTETYALVNVIDFTANYLTPTLNKVQGAQALARAKAE